MQSRMLMQCTNHTTSNTKYPTSTNQAHPTSHHQYPLFSSILPSPLLPIILRFPPLVPITNPLSLPSPSPSFWPHLSPELGRGGVGCGGKWVSIDSSSGVNVGRIGERMCYLSALYLCSLYTYLDRCKTPRKRKRKRGRG
jgi:hypothetical protein